MGLLTDGNSWDFHFIKPIDNGFELYRAPKITTSTEDNIHLILGIAVVWFFLFYRSFSPLLCWDYSERRYYVSSSYCSDTGR